MNLIEALKLYVLSIPIVVVLVVLVGLLVLYLQNNI